MSVMLGCGHRAIIAERLARAPVLVCSQCWTAQPFVCERDIS